MWWMEEKVSSLSLSLPISVQPTVTVEQVLKIMAQEGLNQLTVVSASGLIVGVVTLAGIRGKIGQGEISCTDQIETAVASNFKKVSLETNLRTLSRVLDTDHFAPVVHQQKLCETLLQNTRRICFIAIARLLWAPRANLA